MRTKRRITRRSLGPTQADSARWSQATTDDKATPAEIAWAKTRNDRPLVPERGLKNTRRNRRWLALVRMFSHQVPGGDQALCESLAWAAINTWETTP